MLVKLCLRTEVGKLVERLGQKTVGQKTDDSGCGYKDGAK